MQSRCKITAKKTDTVQPVTAKFNKLALCLILKIKYKI